MSERERNARRATGASRQGVLIDEALARAALHDRPDIERLVAAVPAMITEARRRRRLAAAPAARILDVAFSWLPRLALATGLLAAVALLWPARTGGASGVDESASIDRWLVLGTTPSAVSDPVLEALVGHGATEP